MKRYFNVQRDRPFDLMDRLSRLLTFDIRLRGGVESGADFCAALVLFGHGVVLGFTRGMPHIVGGIYVGVSALTERFDITAGFESDWYHNYLNDPIGAAIVANHGIDVDKLEKGDFSIRLGACVEGCAHEDVAECEDAKPSGATLPSVFANVTDGDLTAQRYVAAPHHPCPTCDATGCASCDGCCC